MDDLLVNFANDDSPHIESTSEEGYIYHFVDESPAPLEHDRPVHASIVAQPNKYTSFFNIETPPPYQSTGGENGDEGDYNADIDDDDDDDDVFGRGLHRAPQSGAYRENPIIDASDNSKPLFTNNATSLDRSSHRQDDEIIELHDLSGRKKSAAFKQASALSDDGQDSDGFKQQLRRFQRQDLERDELLAVCPLPSPLDVGAC